MAYTVMALYIITALYSYGLVSISHAYTVMAYTVMALYSYGLYIYGLVSILHTYTVMAYTVMAIYIDGSYSYGLVSSLAYCSRSSFPTHRARFFFTRNRPVSWCDVQARNLPAAPRR